MESQHSHLSAQLAHDLKSTKKNHKVVLDMLTELPIRSGENTDQVGSQSDDVFLYACEVLTLCLLFAEFEDGTIKEGMDKE